MNRRQLVIGAFLIASTVAAQASDFDVVISEVNFNPFYGSGDEYLELYNRGGQVVDLSGWVISEGVRFVFPAGTSLGPKEFLLVASDAARVAARFGVEEVIGDYEGQLDNGGELVALRNSRADTIARFHYGDGGNWPSEADGLGSTFELRDPHADPDIFSSWSPSLTLDGSPGRAHAGFGGAEELPADSVLIENSEVWRFLRGQDPYPEDWTDVDFDDSDWESGATSIGYGDGDDATVLEDMEDSYLSFAARKRFVVEDDELAEFAAVSFDIDFDDGFVAWLNGVEIGRRNLGEPGSQVPHDAEADDTREVGSPETFIAPASVLRVGPNVLCVQVHNERAGSSDVSFHPRLVAQPATDEDAERRGSQIFINEIAPTEGGIGFVEIYSTRDSALDLSGFVFADSLGNEFSIPPGTVISPGAFVVLPEEDLGFDLVLAQRSYVLLEEDGETICDAINPRSGADGDVGVSFGRYPDGDDDGFVLVTATEGAENALQIETGIVISEINYHPPIVAPGETCDRNCSDPDQWIELHNKSEEEIRIGNWRITRGLRFDFPVDTNLPAGAYVVIASSRDQFLATHPEVDPSLVFGDWQR
ncbi:MAG: lamin tail domain-containing protein, partial [Planctomycetota bacterium]